jgi:hypothetical protein
MSDILYWAVLLDKTNRKKLLGYIPAVHLNVYAEHITLSFQPNELQNKKWGFLLGKKIKLIARDYYEDERGQAITIEGIHRDDQGTPHITISCAEGVKPFYSNKLIKGEKINRMSFSLEGIFAKKTKDGWITGSELHEECEKVGEPISKQRSVPSFKSVKNKPTI